MTKLLKLLALSLAFIMIFGAVSSCSDVKDGEQTERETEKESGEMTEKPTEKPTDKPTDENGKVIETLTVDLGSYYDKVKTHGRVAYSDRGIYCDHSGSGIEFCGSMVGDVFIDVVTRGVKAGCTTTYFTVYIDGVRQDKRFRVEPGKTSLKIASFEEYGEHTVKVIKQTESNYTLLEIRNIILTGTLSEPPAQKELFIEFIGDSLTCGMGNVGTNSSSDPQTPRWEDATQSYGYMVAEALDADYSIVSQSGIGIAGSWFDPLFDYYTKASYSRDKETDHDFSSRTPDLIFINLGTNDYYLNKDKDPNMCKPEEVEQKTEEFIKLVRDCYGEDVPIIWGYGFVGTFLYDNIKGAIDKLGGEDAGIYMIEIPKDTGGAQWHPDVQGHEIAAQTVLPLIKEVLSKQ